MFSFYANFFIQLILYLFHHSPYQNRHFYIIKTYIHIGTCSSSPNAFPFKARHRSKIQGIPQTSHLNNYPCTRDQLKSNRLQPATNSSLATDRRPSCSAMHLPYRQSLSSTRFQIHEKKTIDCH